MEGWRKQLRFDPLPPLLASENQALRYFARRDLLGEKVVCVENLWDLPEVQNILKRQLDDGAWRYPGGGREHLRSVEDYNQIETFRALGQLIEKYGLDNRHPAIRQAADYLFAHQTAEGDFRGIYGNQYTPNYSAAIMELLIKAGYDANPCIERGFQWLLSIRQHDGGWAIPLRTVGKKFDEDTLKAKPISSNKSRPFSHLVTGIVLRAFAAHKQYRTSSEAKTAGNLLASRFFEPDKYADRKAISFWTAFSYPFWFTDLLSSLDSLSLIGLTRTHPQIGTALEWFVARQQDDGVWVLPLLRGAKDQIAHLWMSLVVCRAFKRFFQ